MNSDETREDDVLQTAAEPSGFEAFNELTQYFIAEPKDQGKEYLEPKEGNHADEALAGKKRRRREEDDARSSKGREDTGSQASSTIGATRDGKAESSSMQNDVFLQSVDRLRHAVGEITSADFLLHSTQYQGMMKVEQAHTSRISENSKTLMMGSNAIRMKRTLAQVQDRLSTRRNVLKQKVTASKQKMQKSSQLIPSVVMLSFMDVHDILVTFQYPSHLQLPELLEKCARSSRKSLTLEKESDTLTYFRQRVQNLYTRAMSAKWHGESVLGVPLESQVFHKLSGPTEFSAFQKRLKKRSLHKRASVISQIFKLREAYLRKSTFPEEGEDSFVASTILRRRNKQEQKALCRHRNIVAAWPSLGFIRHFAETVDCEEGQVASSTTTDLFAVPLLTVHGRLRRDKSLSLHRLPVWSLARLYETERGELVVDTSCCLTHFYNVFCNSCRYDLSAPQFEQLRSFGSSLNEHDDVFGFGLSVAVLVGEEKTEVHLNQMDDFLDESRADKTHALSKWLLQSYTVLTVIREHLRASQSLPIVDFHRIHGNEYLYDEGIAMVDSFDVIRQSEERRQRLIPPGEFSVEQIHKTQNDINTLQIKCCVSHLTKEKAVEIQFELYPLLLKAKAQNTQRKPVLGKYNYILPAWEDYADRLCQIINSGHPSFPELDDDSDVDDIASKYFCLDSVRRALSCLRYSLEACYVSRLEKSLGAFSLDPKDMSAPCNDQGWEYSQLSDGLEGSVPNCPYRVLIHSCAVIVIDLSCVSSNVSQPNWKLSVSQRLQNLVMEKGEVKHYYYINDQLHGISSSSL